MRGALGATVAGLLDIRVTRILRAAQQLVELVGIHCGLLSTAAASHTSATTTSATAATTVRMRHAAWKTARPTEREIEHRSLHCRRMEGGGVRGQWTSVPSTWERWSSVCVASASELWWTSRLMCCWIAV